MTKKIYRIYPFYYENRHNIYGNHISYISGELQICKILQERFLLWFYILFLRFCGNPYTIIYTNFSFFIQLSEFFLFKLFVFVFGFETHKIFMIELQSCQKFKR